MIDLTSSKLPVTSLSFSFIEHTVVQLLQYYDPLFCHPIDLFDVQKGLSRTSHCQKSFFGIFKLPQFEQLRSVKGKTKMVPKALAEGGRNGCSISLTGLLIQEL